MKRKAIQKCIQLANERVTRFHSACADSKLLAEMKVWGPAFVVFLSVMSRELKHRLRTPLDIQVRDERVQILSLIASRTGCQHSTFSTSLVFGSDTAQRSQICLLLN